MNASIRGLLIPLLVLACGTNDATSAAETGGSDESGGAATTGDDGAGEPTTGAPEGSTGDESTGEGQGWPDPEDAPSYEGDAFSGMQIYDVARDVWIDEPGLMTALDPVRLVFVGEQHEVAAIHELELWVLSACSRGTTTWRWGWSSSSATSSR